MSLYRKVDPSLWDDESFLELGDDAQSIWLLLLTGPQTCQIPGLQLADAYTLASARRWPVERVQIAINEIAAKRSSRTGQPMAEFDARLRVVRLPNAPRFNAPANPSVLVGWWKEWQRFPASPLKWRHIQSIKESIDFDEFSTVGGSMKSSFDTVWKRTFDTVSNTVSDTMRTPCVTQSAHQDQDQDQDQDQEHTSSASALPIAVGSEPEQIELANPEPARPKALPESAQLLAHYSRRWVETRKPSDGKPPAISRADRGQAAQLTKAHGLTAACEFVDRYLDDPDRWLTEQGHPLRLLASRINGYRARATPSRGISPPIPHSDETYEVKF
jgi:hypothetical protein